VSLPPRLMPILIKDDHTTPDFRRLVTHRCAPERRERPPEPSAEFRLRDDFSVTPGVGVRYRRTVPSGGSITLRFSYEQVSRHAIVRSAPRRGQSFSSGALDCVPGRRGHHEHPKRHRHRQRSYWVQLSSPHRDTAPGFRGGGRFLVSALTLTREANTITAVATNMTVLRLPRQITVTTPGRAPRRPWPVSGGRICSPRRALHAACTGRSVPAKRLSPPQTAPRARSLVGVSAAKEQ